MNFSHRSKISPTIVGAAMIAAMINLARPAAADEDPFACDTGFYQIIDVNWGNLCWTQAARNTSFPNMSTHAYQTISRQIITD